MNITLKVFDHLFKIDCDPAQESNLRLAAADLDQRLLDARASTPRIDSERLAILVALELNQQRLAQSGTVKEQQSCTDLIQQMTHDVETLLKPSA